MMKIALPIILDTLHQVWVKILITSRVLKLEGAPPQGGVKRCFLLIVVIIYLCIKYALIL